MLPLAQLVPALPHPNLAGTALTTSALWPVWRDSARGEVRFVPLSKKRAAKRWHKARAFDRQTHTAGKHGGVIGRTALAVLYVLLFDFLDYKTGQLDPSYDAIARKAGVCRRAVADALQRLKAFGLLHWQRRCREATDALGRFCLKQETNAYAVLPSSQWRGYFEAPAAPPPDPGTWGDHPPLPDQLAQALADRAAGDSARSVLARLADDPADSVACALAGLFGHVMAAKA
ncbi:MAG: hypothetical protein JO001_08610 [Alphaproteobacteria bacterium]|nr:hypothetical protein [Alphaproteobacteria bacterium]